MIRIKELQDQQLIIRVQKKNCEDSLKELIERHSPLCYSVFKRYAPALNSLGISRDDIYYEKDYLIWKTALNFNPNKNSKFSTWLANCLRYKCLNMLNHRHELAVETESLDKLVDSNTSDEPKNKYLFKYFSNILEQITDKRIKVIYQMRYFHDKDKNISWKEIGKKLKISSQTVINLHHKYLHLLKNKFESQNRSDFI